MAIGAAIGSSLIGAIGANKAAKAQERAANRQFGLEERIYEETTDRFSPFYETGRDYYNALRFELLGGDRPTFGGDPLDVVEFTEDIPSDLPPPPNDDPIYYRELADRYNQGPTTRTRYRVGDEVFDDRAAADEYAMANRTGGQPYGGFEATPYQQYVLDTTQKAVDDSAAARGNLFSGATIRASQDRANALAGGFYQDYLSRLTGQAGQGMAAAGNLANAGANFASGAGNALANLGNAQAAGAIGTTNAITGGLNNVLGIMNYQNMQSATPQSVTGIAQPPNIFSGLWQ